MKKSTTLTCALTFAAFAVLACGSSQDVGEGSHVSTNATTASPQTTCDALLACAAVQNPSQLGSYEPEYGATGTCWQSNAASSCGASCQSTIDILEKASPGAACAFCSSDSDCSARYCEVEGTAVQGGCGICSATNTCVGCLSDADCSWAAAVVGGGTARCNTTAGSATAQMCVQCLTDADCPPGKGAGTLCKSNACSECVNDNDCPSGFHCDSTGACSS